MHLLFNVKVLLPQINHVRIIDRLSSFIKWRILFYLRGTVCLFIYANLRRILKMLTQILWFIFERVFFLLFYPIVNLITYIFLLRESLVTIDRAFPETELISILYHHFCCERIPNYFVSNTNGAMRGWHEIWLHDNPTRIRLLRALGLTLLIKELVRKPMLYRVVLFVINFVYYVYYRNFWVILTFNRIKIRLRLPINNLTLRI